MQTTVLPTHEIWASAFVLVRELGDEAALRAAQSADHFLDNGDIESHKKWMNILAAVESLIEEGLARPH